MANYFLCEEDLPFSEQHINRKMMRKFQQYSVEIRRNDAQRLLDCWLIEQLECQGEKIPLYALEEKTSTAKHFTKTELASISNWHKKPTNFFRFSE